MRTTLSLNSIFCCKKMVPGAVIKKEVTVLVNVSKLVVFELVLMVVFLLFNLVEGVYKVIHLYSP